jgi:dynein heavy chain
MLVSWIYAVEQYDRVFKQVKPKQEKLEHAKKEYEVVKRGLDMAQAELKKVTDEITLLTNGLAMMQGRKVELEMRMELCRTKLDRATKLLTSLKGEQGRWTQMATELGVKYEHLTGDVLLSSAVIAYLGPFTQTFRAACIADW